MTFKQRVTDIVKNPGKYRKALSAFVVSAFGVAAVFGFADPDLKGSILAVLTALSNVALVYGTFNRS